MINFILSFFLFFNTTRFHSESQVNVQRFGVDGSDLVDDTKNFDLAVEYIIKKGGTLYVPSGNYYLSNHKRVRRGVHNNNYIFLIEKDFKILLDKNANLHYKNGFKGFRFRSTMDPNDKTVNRCSIEITGGKINGKDNFTTKNNNPNLWGFVGETLKSFKVTNLTIQDFQGTAGITSYSNNYAEISNNHLFNTTGNPDDLVDNHGDGIYIANTLNYNVKNNVIKNDLSKNRIGRIGICIEYERSLNGNICNNLISGYDRGIHVELINGTALIERNKLYGNCSGIVLWNNHGKKQIIKTNEINNIGIPKQIKTLLYTNAPLLMLGYEANKGSEIIENNILIDNQYFIPRNLLQITSSNTIVDKNIFKDESLSLSISISQGINSNQKVDNILFTNNDISTGDIYSFDGSNIKIINNKFTIKKGIISFDKTKNIYKGNKLLIKSNIALYGKYE